MTDLSVVIPARNEEYLQKTIDDIVFNAKGDTEVIAVLDGYTTNIREHPKVKVIHHETATGQRASTNEGVMVSTAKYVMKADGHCAFDVGFDVKLMADCEYDWTVVPLMYNLHVFDWKCLRCNRRQYQGPKPEKCPQCGNSNMRQRGVWKPRRGTQTYSMLFDKDLHFQ